MNLLSWNLLYRRAWASILEISIFVVAFLDRTPLESARSLPFSTAYLSRKLITR